MKWDPPAGNGNDPRPPTNGTNGKPPAQKKTLTLRELAYYLNCSPSSIYYAMRRGWLPARVEEFGQKRFDLDEVLEWLRRPGPPAGR